MDIGQVFMDSYPKFKRYAYSLIKDAASADDLIMEVFKKLLERQDSIPVDVNIEAYVMRSIRNQFYDFLRKERVVTPMDVVTEEQLADSSSSSQVSRESTLDMLLKNLDSLGDNCKNVLSLFGLGYSYNQISEIEEISAGTVMSRMARCREKLLVVYQE